MEQRNNLVLQGTETFSLFLFRRITMNPIYEVIKLNVVILPCLYYA